ncbi:MAG: peptidylprolyl isomerase [Alphaproteobacteria bacterium]|nr:peptidylprolyl isomerase [Alphaproteobacteria bacterium]USO08003.1 MAG: peptidylprolyl isomerase [Rhodospirillales bacterium]
MKTFLTLALGVLLMTTAAASAQDTSTTDKSNIINMETTQGPVVIQLKSDLAPNHVARIKELTQKGFYNGIVFHRVIDGFMAQTGDPTGTGMGGSDLPDLKAEFSNANFGRGTVGMARTSDPDSANSQFFICFEDCSFLNGQYTIWGQVIDGMDNVDKLARGEPPANPDKIVKMELAK